MFPRSVFCYIWSHALLMSYSWASLTTFNVEHSIDGGSLLKVIQKLIDIGHSFRPLTQLVVRPSNGVFTLSSDALPTLSVADRDALLKVAKANGLYSIRVITTATDYLESTVFACQLLSSNMQLKLLLNLNDEGFPVALHATPLKYECLSEHVLSGHIETLRSDIAISLDVQKPVVGSSPETIRYLQRLEKQREEMARVEKGDNRSFFAKYWTYILPAAILFVVFSGIQEASSSNAATGGGGRQ
ncbi:hypothetical protein P879_09667 [Paragonimus westermani]|uniref:ER membrane protein complex subunit 10 n=1 Tax=Paragonimus westermani TaxID=34504 RepID=A0A8T0D558_9TREM|nr:hypothetical protein P879_09667 [Paragonimus westermani]